jgi:AraC family transcriptional regulator, transcriptional activator of pobA
MKEDINIPVFSIKECIGADFVIKRLQHNDIMRYANKLRRHSDYTIHLVLQGEVEYSIDFAKHLIATPSLIFLAPDQVSTITEASKNAEVIKIAFNKEFLISEVKGVISFGQCLFGHNMLHITSEQVDELMVYCDLISKEFNGNMEQKDNMIRSLLQALIVCCARMVEKKSDFKCQQPIPNKKLVNQFISMAEKHYREKTRVAQYAEMLYISPGHLNDTIKAAIGKSAKQVIDEKRVLEAKRLLLWGEHSAKEIAWELNFDDNAYFNRFFKKHTGQTPIYFQRNIREKYN